MACAFSLAATSWTATHGVTLPLMVQILIFFVNLFLVCFLCHGELVRGKPAAQHLTAFYLTISAGGAAGGLFVGLLAPYLFHAYYELNLGIIGCVLLCLGNYLQEEQRWRDGVSYGLKAALSSGIFVGAMFICMSLAGREAGTLATSRNFYGILRVTDDQLENSGQKIRKLVHGRIVHGTQFLSEEGRCQPTTYYVPDSGVGKTLRRHHADLARNVGVVGLGAGTLAVYGKAGDYFRFYEINPDVISMAQDHFSFLSDSAAEISIALGDARLSLEREANQLFDVLVLDAFSGDAVPVHLLTAEAMQVYQRHLTDDGVLAIHISNLHFDLRPVVMGLAKASGFVIRRIENNPANNDGASRSLWMLMSRDVATLDHICGELTDADRKRADASETILWTDDKSNLLQILQ